MRRTSLADIQCSVARTVDVIGERATCDHCGEPMDLTNITPTPGPGA